MARAERPRRSRKSSGNVFEDVGLPRADEELMRADLLFEIYRGLKRLSLTQREMASMLGITQPQVSNLLRGRSAGFSIERLLKLLDRLGTRASIVLTDRGPTVQHPRVPVVRDHDGSVYRAIRDAAGYPATRPRTSSASLNVGDRGLPAARKRSSRKRT